MENLLFVLALLGIVLGAYSLFVPTLRKRGWSLPLMRLVDDDEDDDVDVGDDLDQPLDMAFSEKKARKAKEPKAAKVKGGDKSPPVPERFIVTPGAEIKPLPSKAGPERTKEVVPEIEEIEPGIIVEHPNALKSLDEELDPELQALVDATAEDDVAEAPVPAPVAAAAEVPAVEAVPAAAEAPPTASAPAAEKPADDGNGDILSLFEESEVKDTRPPALREALKLCTMDELRDEAAAMRSILASFNSGQHAA